VQEDKVFNFKRGAPHIPFVLALVIFWTSFAWGLPTDARAGDGDTTPAQPEGAPEAYTAAPAANAGTEVDKTTGWFYLGLGLGRSAIKNWGGDLMANAALAAKHGKYQGTLSGTIGGGQGFDVGLLFGYYPIRKLNLSAGVAWVKGGEYHPYLHPLFASGYVEESETFGVPVEIRYTPVNGRIVGLGLVAHVNFNKENVFGGVTVGIELGKLK
jgi:hypothetical protein